MQPLPAEQEDFLRRWRRAGDLAAEHPEIGRLLIETRHLMRDPDWLYHGDIAELLAATPSDPATV